MKEIQLTDTYMYIYKCNLDPYIYICNKTFNFCRNIRCGTKPAGCGLCHQVLTCLSQFVSSLVIGLRDLKVSQ